MTNITAEQLKVKGYKAFNEDWTCNGFQYEVGKTFKYDGEIRMCDSGFHFCTNLADCFSYYSFDKEKTVIAEVEAIGQVLESESDSKCCTDEIKILKELSWSDVLKGCNSGNRNTGSWNAGNKNKGNRNAGNCNSGNWNTGDWNTGSCNAGNRNKGDRNAGNKNKGNRNAGNCNTGDCNTGNWNTGSCNSGNRNTGSWNAGNRNKGDRNAGDCNTGNWNTGSWNAGDWNTGNYNAGDCNTGDWNTIDYSNGCFNTIEAKIYLFNKLSSWTMSDWLESEARYILNQMQGNDKRQDWWDNLSDDDKKEVLNLPNFDKEIFKQITGIEVEK